MKRPANLRTCGVVFLHAVGESIAMPTLHRCPLEYRATHVSSIVHTARHVRHSSRPGRGRGPGSPGR